MERFPLEVKTKICKSSRVRCYLGSEDQDEIRFWHVRVEVGTAAVMLAFEGLVRRMT